MSAGRCGKKVTYESVAEAMRVLELAKRTWYRPPRRFYRCPLCGGYHLTSHATMPPEVLQEAARKAAEGQR